MPQTGQKRLNKLQKRINVQLRQRAGRRSMMWVGTMKDSGIPVVIFSRYADQMYRGGHTTLTEAMAAGALCWMMDSQTPSYLKSVYGVQYVMIVEREGGDLWLSRIEDWEDDTKLYKSEDGMVRTDTRGFSLRHLPVHHMVKIPADRDLIVRNVAAR